MITQPRQVRLVKCAILSPGLENRAQNADDRATLQTFGIDIGPFVQKIDIYENIFDNTISGTLTVLENIGLTEYLPLVGVETFALIFEIDAPDGTTIRFARAFRVVAVKEQSFPRHDWRLYTIHLVTNEFVRSVSSRICRAFKGVSCEAAVKEILQKDLGVDPNAKDINGLPLLKSDEKTFGKVDVVIPNYTPLMAINYFTTLAQTEKTPRESNFLFFETLDGFHFTSVAALITAGKALPTSKKKVFDVNPGQVSTANTVPESVALNAVMRVHQEQSFDLLFDIVAGTLRSRLITFDFLARKVSKETDGDSRYTKSFGETTHLDDNPFYPNNFDLSVDNNVRIFTVPTNLLSTQSKYISGKDPINEQRMHEAIVLRNRQLREIRHLQTLIDLPGQPDLRAGTVVIVNYPSSRMLEGKGDQNIHGSVWSEGTPYYSGHHLVTAVHHILTAKGVGSMEYRMNVKVNKDSLGSSLYGTTNTEGL